MLLPFSARTRKWEPHAHALRRRLNLPPFELLVPYCLPRKSALELVSTLSL